jgi:methyl-accepting chemotaxis protein
MGTTSATGASQRARTEEAVSEAMGEAQKRLGSPPTFGFLFTSPRHNFEAALATARRGTGLDIIGCTTAGELTEGGLLHGGVAVMLVASDATTSMRYTHGLRTGPSRAASELLHDLPQVKKKASARDQRHLTTVLLTDGLAGTGERLVSDLHEGRIQARSQIVGGAAGDEGKFATTLVGAGEKFGSDAASALHVFSAAPWGVGVDHGLRPTTKPMRVTKAHENVVMEINGEPAFTLYERHAAARGVTLKRESAGPFLIENELGIHFFDKVSRARAPLSVGPDGSLTCAGEIPKGAMVSILDGDPESMIRAARSAAAKARACLEGPAAGVLLFDCVCRGMILKDRFSEEIEAVRSIFPGVPIAGFLTYGEIARSHNELDGWHNTTAVVVAIAQA